MYYNNERGTGIYRIVNKKNGRQYVGSAVLLRRRGQSHIRELIKGVHHNIHLQNDFDKYGADSFLFEVIEFVIFTDLKTLWAIEQIHLDKYYDYQKQCYNIQRYTDQFHITEHSLETIEKIRKALLARPPMKQEVKDKISISNKGKPKAPAHCEAMSKARVGLKMNLTDDQRAIIRNRMLGNTWKVGIPTIHTEDTKRNISIKNKGKVYEYNCNVVYKFDLTGVLLQKYPSIKQAARELGDRDPTRIVRACQQNKRYSSYAYGFLWSNTDSVVLPYRKSKLPWNNIYQFTMDGAYVAQYKTVKEAATAIGQQHPAHIAASARGARNYAYGFKWSYIPPYENQLVAA